MGFLERKLRKRLVKGAEPLALVELAVCKEHDLNRRAVATQDWHVDGDRRAWLEPFLCVGYATKMVTNFRGDQALATWLIACGAIGHDFTLASAMDEADAGGTYAAQAWRRSPGTPFIQTPTTGGSDEFRDLEAGATTDLIFEAMSRNGNESQQRLETARELMASIGTDEFGVAPSVGAAREVTMMVMTSLEDMGAVSPSSAIFGD